MRRCTPSLAILIFTGAIRIWQLVVIEALFGAAQAFFQPAYTGLIPQTVPESEIQDARALTESVANAAFMVGPALATALVLGVGAGEAFAFDAATFLLSARCCCASIPGPRGRRRRPAPVLTSFAPAGARSARARGCG